MPSTREAPLLQYTLPLTEQSEQLYTEAAISAVSTAPAPLSAPSFKIYLWGTVSKFMLAGIHSTFRKMQTWKRAICHDILYTFQGFYHLMVLKEESLKTMHRFRSYFPLFLLSTACIHIRSWFQSHLHFSCHMSLPSIRFLLQASVSTWISPYSISLPLMCLTSAWLTAASHSPRMALIWSIV